MKLRLIDYVAWVVTIAVMWVLFLWVGDFGLLPYLAQSPVSQYVENLWRITYVSASGVFGVFMGSLIFLSLRSDTLRKLLRGRRLGLTTPRS